MGYLDQDMNPNSNDDPHDQAIDRDISATREEFARGVRAAFPDARATPEGWQVEHGGAKADISLSPLSDLVIALLRLPRHRCRIRLDGPGADRKELLDRLDRYQQRGGG
jgi:hypothetical protein